MTEEVRIEKFKEELDNLVKKYGVNILALLKVEQPSHYFSNIKAEIGFQLAPNWTPELIKEQE